LTQLKVKSPDTKYLVLTVDDRAEAIVRAFEGGADGYLIKGQTLEELEKAIQNFLNGDIVMSPSIARRLITWFQNPTEERLGNLTQRQWEILQLASQGKQQGEIALLLNISLHTVKNHFRNIYQKLQVHTLRDALIKLRRGRHLLND
jgi:DNA-binding NarL/FixJ family response regulator